VLKQFAQVYSETDRSIAEGQRFTALCADPSRNKKLNYRRDSVTPFKVIQGHWC